MQENHWMGQDMPDTGKMGCTQQNRQFALVATRACAVFFSILITLCTVFSLAAVALASSQTLLTNSQGGIYFTGSSADPGTLYQDAVGANVDAGIRLCGFGARYVGGFYAINISGTFLSALVTYQSSSQALSFTDAVLGGGCFETTPGFLTISPSNLVTPNPIVYKAAFPARLWTGYDVVANPGANISNFVLGGNDSYLRGNYTVARAFDYSTRTVTIQTPIINFESSSANFSKSANDSSFGLAADRRMVIGTCTDTDGANCADGQLYTSAAFFPATYATDLLAGQMTDQQKFTRYVVVNGLGQPMCIGANAQVSVDFIAPSPAYYSQTLTIQTTVTNKRDAPYDVLGGNVPITTPFSVNIRISPTANPAQTTYTNTVVVNPTLTPGASTQLNFSYPAFALSGQYSVVATVDTTNALNECNETDNNATSSFQLNPIITPIMTIDQVQTNTFAYPNVPYSVGIIVRNSDNLTVPNATVQLVEVNGLSINAGTQLFNISTSGSTTAKSGVISQSSTQTTTDYTGATAFTYVPTYNQFYDAQYNYLSISQYLGNTQRYLTGTAANGTQFVFIINNTVTTQYPLYVANPTYNITVVQKTVNYNVTIAQTFDNIYRVFTNYVKTLIG